MVGESSNGIGCLAMKYAAKAAISISNRTNSTAVRGARRKRGRNWHSWSSCRHATRALNIPATAKVNARIAQSNPGVLSTVLCLLEDRVQHHASIQRELEGNID